MNASGWVKSRLLLLSCAIALGIGALVVYQLLESRSATWQRAIAANTNLLFTVSHVLERTLEDADHGLRQSVEVLERTAFAFPNEYTQQGAARQMFRGLDTKVLFAGISHAGFGIQLVLDDHGRILFASRPPPPGEWLFDHREYFALHRNGDVHGLYIGAPFLSSYDNEPSLALSRRWNRPDGSFGGVVVQTMKLSVLNGLFASFELGRDSGIYIFLNDGRIVTGYPYTPGQMGQSLSGTANFERFIKERHGNFTGIAALGGMEQLYVYRTLEPFPLIVSVAQASASILDAWNRNALWLGGATLLLMCACVALAVFAERSLLAQRGTAQQLRQAQHELRTILDGLPVMIGYWDKNLVNRMSNEAHREWLGREPSQMVGRHIDDLLTPERRALLQPHIDRALAGEPQYFESVLPDQAGRPRYASFIFIPDYDGGQVKGFFVMVTDVSKRKKAEVALFQEKERFRIILDSIKDGVITTNPEGKIRYVNPAAAALIGWGLDEARGKPIESVMRIEAPEGGPPNSCPLRDALNSRKALQKKVEHVLISRDGTRTHIEHSSAPLLDEQGQLSGAVLVFHEAGHVRAIANKMTHLAQHDALTGLPNRRRLDLVGNAALEAAKAGGRCLAVLYLDLDGFKQVNDAYGHAVGDDLLIAVTRRLSARLRSSDGLYRQGGDEFIVLMTDVASLDEARRLADRLIESCRSPVSVAGIPLAVTVSIGIGLYPDDADDLAALILRSDRAMYMAKNSGRNRYVCVSELDSTLHNRAVIG